MSSKRINALAAEAGRRYHKLTRLIRLQLQTDLLHFTEPALSLPLNFCRRLDIQSNPSQLLLQLLVDHTLLTSREAVPAGGCEQMYVHRVMHISSLSIIKKILPLAILKQRYKWTFLPSWPCKRASNSSEVQFGLFFVLKLKDAPYHKFDDNFSNNVIWIFKWFHSATRADSKLLRDFLKL